MIGTFTVLVLVLTILWTLWNYLRNAGSKIPGPKGLPILGVTLKVLPVTKFHLILNKWCRQYGPIMRIKTINGSLIVLSDFDTLQEMLFKQGVTFGAKKLPFRARYCMGTTGLGAAVKPDSKLRHLRKKSHQHLKQYGDGITVLDEIIRDVGEEMFEAFKEKFTEAFDPKQTIFDAALKTIAVLITGERPREGDIIFEGLRRYEKEFFEVVNPISQIRYTILDLFPWLRHLGYPPFRRIADFVHLEADLWNDLLTKHETRNFACALMSHLEDSITKDYTELDARHATFNLLLAGITTSANSFYTAVNILAHNPKIQEVIFHEIQFASDKKETESYFRSGKSTPYIKAFLFELLRFNSVAPNLLHSNTETVTLNGYMIPKDSDILGFAYTLHHDPDFWQDPDIFRPERFLDEAGEVLPADHPNRRHLMAFGGGPRGCIGENLAMSRLYAWLYTLVQRMKVKPAPGNLPSSIDLDNFTFDGVVRAERYEIVLTPR